MNILLWVLQIALALYYLMGGIYQVTHHKMFTKGVAHMKPLVMGLGLLQALFALALVLPAALGILSKLCSVAAACLAVQTLLVSVVLFKIRKFSALIWILAPAILALFVAYGRYVLSPLP